jgi:RNA polymerase sigma factor (sigma-70 family)
LFDSLVLVRWTSGACVDEPVDLDKLRPKLRFKVAYAMGFLCPDIDDIVQETLARFLVAFRDEKVRNPEASAAFLNGICRNVISEYRRRSQRDEPMPETAPDLPDRALSDHDRFAYREAIIKGMELLPDRDRKILRAFYLEEKTKDEVLRLTGLTEENFRVVLCRAKERFRKIYLQQTQHRTSSRHSSIGMDSQ